MIYSSLRVLLFLLLITACNAPKLDKFLSGNSGSVSRLDLPLQDHGYSNLSNRVIDNQKEFEALLSDIETQSGWNHKIKFGVMLDKEKINFLKYNLLIYTHTESSGSNTITTHIAKQDTNVTVTISSKAAEVGTADMAYYALFYRVSKRVEQITFKSPQKIVTIQNKRDITIVPKECIAWYDGCNHCIRSDSGKSMCTRRHCKKKGTFRCVKWK